MQQFHVVIRALPIAELPTRSATLADATVTALLVPPELQSQPLGVSFEEASVMLEKIPRMFIEPDGSFVCVSPPDEEVAWQVDGNLFDRDGSLVAIDLKGSCRKSFLLRLLDVFRANERRLMIELVRDAVFVREHDFLQLLS